MTMENRKQKQQRVGVCDYCTYCLYRDENVSTCAYFGQNLDYRYVRRIGGCRAFVARPVSHRKWIIRLLRKFFKR